MAFGAADRGARSEYPGEVSSATNAVVPVLFSVFYAGDEVPAATLANRAGDSSS